MGRADRCMSAQPVPRATAASTRTRPTTTATRVSCGTVEDAKAPPPPAPCAKSMYVPATCRPTFPPRTMSRTRQKSGAPPAGAQAEAAGEKGGTAAESRREGAVARGRREGAVARVEEAGAREAAEAGTAEGEDAAAAEEESPRAETQSGAPISAARPIRHPAPTPLTSPSEIQAQQRMARCLAARAKARRWGSWPIPSWATWRRRKLPPRLDRQSPKPAQSPPRPKSHARRAASMLVFGRGGSVSPPFTLQRRRVFPHCPSATPSWVACPEDVLALA